jgi:hypothetical protein
VSQVLITPPVSEPVLLTDAANHLRQDPSDPTIPGFISAARAAVENHTHRVLCTQTWQYLRDGWPPFDPAYTRIGYAELLVPKPPFQSLDFLKYLDTSATWQTMPACDNTGMPPTGQFWGYQIDPGGPVSIARLTPPYAVPWPPLRRIPNNVILQWTSGYGQFITIGIAAESAVITGASFLPTDVGSPITIPGAGAAGASLVTAIESVDDEGNATLATAASTAVAGYSLWWGPMVVPPDILIALKMQMAWLFKYRGDDPSEDPEDLAPGVTSLLRRYRVVSV